MLEYSVNFKLQCTGLIGSFLPPPSSSELSRYSQRISSFFRNFCFLHWFRIRCRMTPSEVLLSLDDSDAFFCCGFSRKFLDLRCSHLLLLALCPETSRTTNMVLTCVEGKTNFIPGTWCCYSYALHSTDGPETDRVDKIFDQVTGGASKVKVTGCWLSCHWDLLLLPSNPFLTILISKH